MMLVKGLVLASIALSSSLALAIGPLVQFSNIELKPANSPYVGLGQMTREIRRTNTETIFLEYSLGGEKRRLWDDDGLATLFLYHRNLTAKVRNGEIKMGDALPQPKTPLIKALDMLANTYQGVAATNTDPVYKEMVMRILTIKARLTDGPGKVSDLADSGLEQLINDLISSHTYLAEVGNDKSVRKPVSELIAVGVPQSFTDSMNARCQDKIVMDWTAAAARFEHGQTSKVPNQTPSRSTNQ